uniref:Uncharacterized protein n=1 Tax=Cucumis melo TaxID=3656 RepID=A0A9I9E200_CUCME
MPRLGRVRRPDPFSRDGGRRLDGGRWDGLKPRGNPKIEGGRGGQLRRRGQRRRRAR